jgi:glycosyltransferase involved in cell wall biosynthesis
MKLDKYFPNDNSEYMPMISVLLPVYNGGVELIASIESILCQTYKNFELIIIDDGSTDCSLDILNHYKSLDNRIRLISRENRGLVTTLNEALNFAKAPWVARMDQDDICFPNRFEKQLCWLEESGSDICGSWIKYFGKDNNICRYYMSDEAIKMEMLFKSPFAHPAVMMSTELAKGLKYDLNCENAEDYDLWVRAAMAEWKMSNVQEVLLKYRRHETQMTSKSLEYTQSVSKNIRKYYWDFISNKFGLSDQDTLEVQKFINSDFDTQMTSVNSVFHVLLKQSAGEVKNVLTDNISRLYLKSALNNKNNLIVHWLSLNSKYRFRNFRSMQFKLFFLSILNLKKEGQVYNTINYYYKKFFM